MGVLLRAARYARAAAGRPRRRRRRAWWRRHARWCCRRRCRRRQRRGGALGAGAVLTELAVHRMCTAYRVPCMHTPHAQCMHSACALPVQVVPAELLYAPSSGAANFTQTYPMDYTYNDYNEPLRRRFRAAAHAVLPPHRPSAKLPRTAPPHRPSAPPACTARPHRPSAPSTHPRRTLVAPSATFLQVLGEGAALVRPVLRRRARAEWRRWRRASSHILGVHVRGTDKVIAPRVTQHGQGSSSLGAAPSSAPAPPHIVLAGGSGRLHTPSGGERETEPLDTEPLPRVLERAASNVADSTAPGHAGATRGLLSLRRRLAREGARRAGIRRDGPGELPPPLRGALWPRRCRGRRGRRGPRAVVAGGAPD